MNIEINTDNNLLQNRTKSTNCDGLSVSKKIDLFERYLKENSNESIHSNTIFEGYNIGRILIQLRYLMKNNLIKYNSEEFKRMENLGLLENTKETIYVKIKRLKQFCEKHPYAFSNIYRLRKDLNKKEKMEFEKVFKDYTYIRERKSRGKLPQKLEEELNNSQIGGVFKKEDIGELYEKYEIGDKEKRQIINEFGNMENLKKSYKKYMIKLANAKNYNEIHRIKIENKESAMENPKIPLVRNFYLGSQSLEKQKALLNFISYMYGEKYATNIILGPEVDVILEKILREMLTDRERHIVEFKFGLKREEEIPKEVRNMKQQSMYQIMCYQVVRKMRKKEIKDVLTSMYNELKQRHQIYVVAPLIEESDKIDLKNVYDLEEKFNKAFGKICNIDILHGKMKPSEKEEIMQKFKENKINILISTTVIEVGVDVKNATMMVIFDAERFGLSALHQLRGRVGRNNLQSYCILISNYEKERLNVLTKTNDGFKVSEEDFLLRGSGDIFGLRQSGDMIFKMADLKQDFNILLKAKEDSEYLLKNLTKIDPKEQQKYLNLITKATNLD